MFVYIRTLIFFMILIKLSSAMNDEELRKPFTPCGLYGFRCLDTKRAQICDDKKDVEESSKKPRIYECAEGLICDEEKVEFCSPRVASENDNRTCSCSKDTLLKRNSVGCPCRKSRGVKIFRDEPFEDDFKSLSKTVLIETNNADDFSDDDEPTTEKDEIDPWNGSPPINCDTHGFYPDNNNKSRFFFCDLKKKGHGFILRHMVCGSSRFFEPNFKACVLKGSTRKIRHEKAKDEPQIISSAKTSNFFCDKKKPGKYPDRTDRHIYHLCLPKKLFEPFEHLSVECPHSTAFDPIKKICSKKALKVRTDKVELDVYCDQEIRFRELRSCDRYFLCYKDQVVEFMCPSGFQFDEKLQFCEPENFVTCE